MSHRFTREELYKALFIGYAFLLFILNFPDRYMRWWFCIILLAALGIGVWAIKWNPETRRSTRALNRAWQFALILTIIIAAASATVIDWMQNSEPIIRHFPWIVFILLYYPQGVLWAVEHLILRLRRRPS